MGWDFGYESKAETVRNLLDPARFVAGYKPITHKLVGSDLWIVVETPSGQNMIVLYRIATRRGMTGYMGMPESSGPYYFTCPLSFLDMAPETNPEWRAKVRAHHARNEGKKDIRVGSKVLVYGKPYTVVGRIRRSLLVVNEAGRQYRIGTRSAFHCQEAA